MVPWHSYGTTPVGVSAALDQLNRDLPQLTDMRHSIAHYEDRIQGRGRHQRQIEPDRGLLVIEGFYNRRIFVTTAEDGSHVGLEITGATLDMATKAVQAAFDSFKWEGSPEHLY